MLNSFLCVENFFLDMEIGLNSFLLVGIEKLGLGYC